MVVDDGNTVVRFHDKTTTSRIISQRTNERLSGNEPYVDKREGIKPK